MNPKDQVKENLSITDVVSTYIRLEKSGAQFRARCPFHNERTPSFYVSPERKSFHCFGCQASGDIFSFVEKIENIPFFEALKILADRAGVSLRDANKHKEDGRLISLLKDATDRYIANLQTSPEAKHYLLERGLTEETIKTFSIGYAKNEWRDIFITLTAKGYSPEEIESSGVAIKALDDQGNTKGWYDRFRGRVMFPIRNVSGATVGYSGRIMPSLVDPTVAQGKYVNTPETALYHKSKILFGYDTAKKMMNESKEVVVVEGQMDLCMSYQAGVHNTVAVSGTAFTDEHIHIIKRFCERVILSFDTDTAGQNALKKTALLCLLGGLDVYVVGDIGTKDPADLIRENPNLWREAIQHKRHIIEVMLSRIMTAESDMRIRGQKIVSDVLPYVRAVTSPIDRAHFVRMIAEKASIDQETLREELSRGGGEITQETKEESIQVPAKERLSKELIASAILMDKVSDERYVALTLDKDMFPEAIIQEELFRLEEKLPANKEAYFTDLITSYKKILHKEEIEKLKHALQDEEGNHEAIMKQLHDLIKKGI